MYSTPRAIPPIPLLATIRSIPFTRIYIYAERTPGTRSGISCGCWVDVRISGGEEGEGYGCIAARPARRCRSISDNVVVGLSHLNKDLGPLLLPDRRMGGVHRPVHVQVRVCITVSSKVSRYPVPLCAVLYRCTDNIIFFSYMCESSWEIEREHNWFCLSGTVGCDR